MLTSEFKSKFLPILKNKVKVKEYNSKGYSKKHGNISAHKDEYNLDVFNYIDLEGEVFHVAYPYEVELTKEGRNGLYGIIKGSFIKPIDLEYLKPFMDFQELESPVQEIAPKKGLIYKGEPFGVDEEFLWGAVPLNLKKETFVIENPNPNSVSEQVEWFFSTLSNKFIAKSKEYSTDSWDSNFVKGARVLGTSKEQALLGYATKHLVSIMDISEGKQATKEEIDEKFGDLIVYFSLLRVMLLEKVK